MKKILVPTLVLILLVMTAFPAFARRGTDQGDDMYRARRGTSNFSLTGKISALDSEAGTVTVHVVSGNRLVKTYLDQDLTLQTGENTRFLLKTSDGTVTVSFADLAVDQKVSVAGVFVEDVWTVMRITIGAKLCCQP